jgi:hypothetical protein
MTFNESFLMDVAGQAGSTAIFGLGLWLKCALAGAGIGALVAAAQVFSGRWHPAWATRLIYWFSCPFFAGLAAGVVLALKSVPALAPARGFWLILCLVIGAFTATVAAAVVAYFSRNYDRPNAANKSMRVSRRAKGQRHDAPENWEDRLRSIFRPEMTADEVQPNASVDRKARSGKAVTPGLRGKLPPERFPAKSELAKPPHYAGHPRQVRLGHGKLEKPIK